MYIVLNKNWKIYWSTKLYWSWSRGPVLIVTAKSFMKLKSDELLNLEWMSECSLTPSDQYFSFIMARTSYFCCCWWDDKDACFIVDRCYLFFYSVHWSKSTCRDMLLNLKTLSLLYPNSVVVPTILCSYSKILCWADKQQTSILLSEVSPHRGFTTLEVSMLS